MAFLARHAKSLLPITTSSKWRSFSKKIKAEAAEKIILESNKKEDNFTADCVDIFKEGDKPKLKEMNEYPDWLPDLKNPGKSLYELLCEDFDKMTLSDQKRLIKHGRKRRIKHGNQLRKQMKVKFKMRPYVLPNNEE
ncbi:hypothetical protein MHBO_001872 [Bonamia ostreae]|uniref:Large ribosomal subunit protein mL54 n=1 Tax=Bonamia ostreae TaxID=126728 RepID=A0ABV2AL93_9EUKA